jgi:hypothetical protein
MAEGQESAQPPGERLARRYFELAGEGRDPRMLEIMHPEVEILVRKVGGRRLLRGPDEVRSFLGELEERFPVFQSFPEQYRPIDDERVVVEGRMRWMDADRVLRDDPMIWALEFREGLLYRSTAARSVTEAQAILARGAQLEAE